MQLNALSQKCKNGKENTGYSAFRLPEEEYLKEKVYTWLFLKI